MNAEIQPMAEKTADRLRDQFLVTLRELDRRRQRAMDVRGLLRENRRALVAAGARCWSRPRRRSRRRAPLRRFRDRRLPRRRLEALSRAWENPDRVAIDADRLRRRLGLVLTLVKIAAVAAGSGLVRRKFQRALPSGS